MKHIVILAGGTSNEREVSLRSGVAVSTALKEAGYGVKVVDPAGVGSIGTPDAVFPALHGKDGEDGTIQAALESRGLPYVGCGVAASALCFDKWLYRQVLQAASMPVPQGELVVAKTLWDSKLTKRPFVLKPIQGGSSVDTLVVRDLSKMDKSAVEAMVDRYGQMLVEELVQGTEMTVGILDQKPLHVVEIIPPENGEFDYENKYNGLTQELCPPVNITAEQQERAQELAMRAHRLTSCRDLSRTDIMLDSKGDMYILETNTLPGFTDQSLYPKAALASGLPFPKLCDQLVQLALRRA